MNQVSVDISKLVANGFNTDVAAFTPSAKANGDFVVAAAILNSSIGIIAALGAMMEVMMEDEMPELCDNPDCENCNRLRQIDEDNPEHGTQSV